ncbi:MAG: hypothetical protein HYS12_22820 [Planctomycetes bacterium]|nr:hypothetical protein [Planctomycetota bacterium]
MLEIILTQEQAAIVASALKPIHVRDPSGNLLGILDPPWTEADIEDALRRRASDEPGFSFQQVMEHLRSLERQ